MTNAAFKLGLRRAQFQSFRHLAEHRCLSCFHNQHLGGSAADTGTHEDAVGSLRQAGICRDSARLFLYREGFSGKHCLVDKEVICFQHDTIGRDQTARGERHHIAWHHLFGG